MARPFSERVQAMNSSIVAKCNPTVEQTGQNDQCEQGVNSLKSRTIGRLQWNNGRLQWNQGHGQWHS